MRLTATFVALAVALVAGPQVARANVASDASSLLSQYTGLDFGSWDERTLRSLSLIHI